MSQPEIWRDVAFIKIDVQGYELAVCEGMRQTLQKFPALVVAFEYAPDGMRELGFEPLTLLDFFRSAGYQLHILTRSATTLAPENRCDLRLRLKSSGYVDVLCSRRSPRLALFGCEHSRRPGDATGRFFLMPILMRTRPTQVIFRSCRPWRKR